MTLDRPHWTLEAIVRLPRIVAAMVLAPPLALALSAAAYAEAVAEQELTALPAVVDVRTAAEQGNAMAQVLLGRLYTTDLLLFREDFVEAYRAAGVSPCFCTVPADYDQAVRWFGRAATQGNAQGQALLAYLYYHGKGAAQNHVRAFQLFESAAEQGHTWAQSWIGYLYATGEGVAQDHVEAARWYRLAAEKGDAYAQHQLANTYRWGDSDDRVRAYAWLLLAAAQGEDGAEPERELAATRLTDEQIAEAKSLAWEFWGRLVSSQQP